MFFHERDEILGRVSSERGFREVWICGDEIFRRAVNVCEVTASSAGDEDFFANALGVIEKCDAASALAGFDGAH